MKLLIAILIAVSGSIAYAQSLTLDEAIGLAQDKSWNSLIEKQNYEKVLLQRRQVLATALPQVSAQASYNNYLNKPQIGGFSLNSTHQVDMGLTVRQKLFEFGGIGNSLEAAAALLQQSDYQKKQVENYIRHETTIAYYSVLLTERQLKISEESLENARNNLRFLRQSFAAGRAPRGDILRLETDIVSRQSTVNMARTELESSYLVLKEILKIAEDAPLKLSTPLDEVLPVLEKEALNEVAINENLDLKILESNKDYLQSASLVERSSMLPKLGLFYNLSRSGRSDEKAFSMEENVNTQVIGLELTWSLWDGGGNKARYDERKRDVMVADYSLKRSQDKVLLDLNKAIKEYESIRNNLETDRKSLKLAQESFSLVQDLLKVGKTSITELNSTEGLLISIKVNYIVNLFRAHERLSLINYLTSARGL